MARMTRPKPSETVRNQSNLVSLLACGKLDRNHRNHSLRERAIWFRPLRAHSSHRSALVETPLRWRCAHVFRHRCASSRTINHHARQSGLTSSIITSNPTASRCVVSTGGGGRDSAPRAAARVDIQQRGRPPIDHGGIPRLAARPVDSFAALDRHETAASGQAHQRPSQRFGA